MLLSSTSPFAISDSYVDRLVKNAAYYSSPVGHDSLVASYARGRMVLEELPDKVPVDYHDAVEGMITIGLKAGTYEAATALISICSPAGSPATSAFKAGAYSDHDAELNKIVNNKQAYSQPANHEKLAVTSATSRATAENLVSNMPADFRETAISCVQAAMTVAITHTALALLPLQVNPPS